MKPVNTVHSDLSQFDLHDWVENGDNPVRPGVYLCEWDYVTEIEQYFNYWNGFGWASGGKMIRADHKTETYSFPCCTLKRWRGLKQPAE